MAKKPTAVDWAKAAAKARSDLNIFAGVVALLEGGTLSADANPDDSAIIKRALSAQQRCLRRYDRALEKIGATRVDDFE